MFVKISAKPVDTVLVQVYMPTTNHGDDDIEKLYEEQINAKEVMEQKFSQIDGKTGSIEENWGKVKETLLDVLNNDIGKTEITPRNP
jgi:hypothetical protein